MNLNRFDDGTRSLRLPVLTSFSLIERVTTLTVKVTKMLSLDEIKACAFDAAEQFDNLLMRNEGALITRHKSAAPLV